MKASELITAIAESISFYGDHKIVINLTDGDNDLYLDVNNDIGCYKNKMHIDIEVKNIPELLKKLNS